MSNWRRSGIGKYSVFVRWLYTRCSRLSLGFLDCCSLFSRVFAHCSLAFAYNGEVCSVTLTSFCKRTARPRAQVGAVCRTHPPVPPPALVLAAHHCRAKETEANFCFPLRPFGNFSDPKSQRLRPKPRQRRGGQRPPRPFQSRPRTPPRLCRLTNHCRPRRPRHQPKPCLPHLCCHASRDIMTFDYAGLAVPALPGFSWCHRCNQTVPPFSMTDSTIQLFLGPPGLSFAKRAGATLYSSTSRGCSP